MEYFCLSVAGKSAGPLFWRHFARWEGFPQGYENLILRWLVQFFRVFL
jgi:hypothetical protein